MPYQQHHVAPYTATGIPAEFGNIFQNYAEGYKQGNVPRDTLLRQQGEALKNALTEQYGGREKEADINYKNAMSSKLSDPMRNLSGIADEAYGLNQLENKFGKDNPWVNLAQQAFQNKTNSLDLLTTGTRGNNQMTIQAIDNITPQLEQLNAMEVPNQIIGQYINPNQQAAYDALVASNADSLVKAFQLPNTNEGIHLAKTMLQRRPLETHSAYKKRIAGVMDDLKERRKRLVSTLQNRKVNYDNKEWESKADDDISTYPDDKLLQMWKDPNTSEAVRAAIEDVAHRRR